MPKGALLFALAAVLSLGLSACASSGAIPPGTAEADKVLLDRGNEALADKNSAYFTGSVSETFFQVPSGLYEVIRPASLAVSGPRSF